MIKQAVLLVNTRSRTGKLQFRDASTALRDRGIELVQALASRDAGQLTATAQSAIQKKVPLIVVGGGDGTISSIVPCIVGSDSVLGVLPLGTGNQFARDLGIAPDVATACDVISQGKVAAIDLGKINDRYFLNVATVGLTTRIAEALTSEEKRKLGRIAYVFALVRALARVRPFKVKLQVSNAYRPSDAPPSEFQSDSSAESPERDAGESNTAISHASESPLTETHTLETLQVVIGNGRFHAGPFPLAPDASITDGRLVVYAVAGTSRWNLLRFALNLPGGHHVELADVPCFETPAGSLECAPVQRVTVDGEIVLNTPLRFKVAPGALRVMVPQAFPASDR